MERGALGLDSAPAPLDGAMGGPLRFLSQGSCLFLEELRSSCFSAGAAERCGAFSPPLGRSHSSAGGTGWAAGQGQDFPRRENPTRGDSTPGGDNPHCTATAQPPTLFDAPMAGQAPHNTSLISSQQQRGSHALSLLPKTGSLQHRGYCHREKLRQTPQIPSLPSPAHARGHLGAPGGSPAPHPPS